MARARVQATERRARRVAATLRLEIEMRFVKIVPWMFVSFVSVVAVGGCASPGNQPAFLPPMAAAPVAPAAPIAPPSTAPAAGSPSGIAGHYAATFAGQRAEIVLEADGSALFDGQRGAWSYQNGAILLDDGQQRVQAGYDGNAVVIQGPQGSIAFQRVGAGAAPGPAPTPAVDQRLIGCWDSFSSTSSASGNSSFQRTIQFAPDGRYAGRSFASVSVPGIEGLSGGGSDVDESHEEGSWSSSGATVALAPSNGAAYQVGYRLDGGLLFLDGNKFVPCH
jgi:hypothetical protein